jgi:DedD protein
VAEVDGTKRVRVRVGPFNSREDAEKAAGKLKAAGLPAAIFTL